MEVATYLGTLHAKGMTC